MLETATILKIFGLGVVGTMGTMILTRVGKPDLALVLDILLLAGVVGYGIYKVKGVMDSILTMFGV